MKTSSGGQIKDSTDRVKVISFHARPSNAGYVYVGVKGVSASAGWELEPGDREIFDFQLARKEGSMPFNTFYVSVSGNDKVDWAVIKE